MAEPIDLSLHAAKQQLDKFLDNPKLAGSHVLASSLPCEESARRLRNDLHKSMQPSVRALHPITISSAEGESYTLKISEPCTRM